MSLLRAGRMPQIAGSFDGRRTVLFGTGAAVFDNSDYPGKGLRREAAADQAQNQAAGEKAQDPRGGPRPFAGPGKEEPEEKKAGDKTGEGKQDAAQRFPGEGARRNAGLYRLTRRRNRVSPAFDDERSRPFFAVPLHTAEAGAFGGDKGDAPSRYGRHSGGHPGSPAVPVAVSASSPEGGSPESAPPGEDGSELWIS